MILIRLHEEKTPNYFLNNLDEGIELERRISRFFKKERIFKNLDMNKIILSSLFTQIRNDNNELNNKSYLRRKIEIFFYF